MPQSKEYDKWRSRYMLGVLSVNQLNVLVQKSKLTEEEKELILNLKLSIVTTN